MLKLEKIILLWSEATSVKPGPEDNYHFNDRTFYLA